MCEGRGNGATRKGEVRAEVTNMCHNKNNAVNDISNVVFLEGNKCALLIDASGSVQTAKKILDNVNAISNKNICYIVTTHGHPDHYIGSTFFKHRRIKFIVHENFNKYLNTRIKRDLINQGFDVSDASLYNFNDQILVTNSNFLKIDLGDRVITIEALEKSQLKESQVKSSNVMHGKVE